MQIFFNGLISGLTIALLAVAFQVVYLPTRVFFIGLAGLYTFAPYSFLISQQLTGSWQIAITISLFTVVSLALFFEWSNHAPLARKGASEWAHLISSLGIYIITVQIVSMIWGNETQTLRTGLDATLIFGDTILTGSELLMVSVSVLLLSCFLMILHLSEIGLRLRALADNHAQFALFGYNVNIYRFLAFGLSGVFVTAAALSNAWDIGFDPYSGLHAVLLAAVAVIIGGRHSFVGPIVGGVLLGIIRSQVVWHLSARWQEAATFTLLAIFLLLKPHGILGQKIRVEADT